MKIIIENDLVISFPDEPMLGYVLHQLVRKYSISKRIEYIPSYRYTILAQKIELKESSMNKFLSALSDLVEFNLEFIPQGDGCETKFILIPKTT